jgi:kumamolisin
VADDAGLARYADAVANPLSPLYGHYLSVAALARRFGARPGVAARAVRALRAAGARSVTESATRMDLTARLTVAAAERLFAARMSVFHPARGAPYLAPTVHAARAGQSVAPPGSLRGLITGVVGLDTRSLGARPRLHTAAAQATGYLPRTGTAHGCSAALRGRGFTPNQYLTAYGFDPLHNAGLRGGGERLALIEIDGFRARDITTFDRCFGIHTPPVHTYTVGFRGALAPGGESTLDVELVTAAAPRVSSIDVYENRGDAAAVLRAFTAPLITPGARPDVVSASLGICEPYAYLALGNAGVGDVERDLELATSAGITVLAAAGDTGSSGCQTSDGSIVPRLAVNYPAASPYVTGVGGTNVALSAANFLSAQTVWNDGGQQVTAGGGGVSDLFSRPSYQKPFVSVDARIVPDVAMLSDLAPGYEVYCTARADGCPGWVEVGGTSGAAPLLAGGVALVDQDLRRRHRTTLGLLNPLLYRIDRSSARASVLSDVTSGDNDLGPYLPGGGHPLGCCTAAAGFDPASGLGSVNVAGLDRSAIPAEPRAPDVTLTLPRQRPLRARDVVASVRCSTACRAYVSGQAVLPSGAAISLRSAIHRFRRAGTQRFVIGFTRAQESRLVAAARKGPVAVELFAVALDAHGRALRVSSAAALSFR